MGRELRFASLPHSGGDFADGKSLFGDCDGGLEQRAKRPGTEPGAERFPSVHGAGDRPGERPCLGKLRQSASAHRGDGRRARRTAARIEPVQLPRAGVPHQREQVAAHSARHRLDGAEHRIHRDRRVDGISAAAEHLDSGLHGERLARRGHSVHRMHRRATHAPGSTHVPRSPQLDVSFSRHEPPFRRQQKR